jgi:hypothetical protein
MAEWMLDVLLFWIPTILTGSILFKLSSERIGGGDYGFPLFQNIRVWRAEQYTERGQRLLPWLFGSVLLQAAGVSLLIWVL